jgi:hypothetical protein
MASLGRSAKPLRNPRANTSNDLRASNSGPEQPPSTGQVLSRLAEHAWDDLPYQIMRLTARDHAPHQRFYWRNEVLYLGEAQLSFATSQRPGHPPTYRAIFRSDPSKPHPSGRLNEELILSPALEGTELRWIAPALSDSHPLTSQQLATNLLTKFLSIS